jgi:hypothetical protein
MAGFWDDLLSQESARALAPRGLLFVCFNFNLPMFFLPGHRDKSGKEVLTYARSYRTRKKRFSGPSVGLWW